MTTVYLTRRLHSLELQTTAIAQALEAIRDLIRTQGIDDVDDHTEDPTP